jgi:threonine/homoserine/homoserine lactone efflux protein
MLSDPEPEGRSSGSTTVASGLARGLRIAWATEKGRRRIVISTGVAVAVIVIVIAAALFASLAGESQSYRDGYSAGGAAYTAYGASKITSEQACRDEEVGPGGRPARDNAAQWVQGCADAFNLAASDN